MSNIDILVTALNDSLYLFPVVVAVVLLLIYLSSLFGDYDLNGKHVFITGGSSGIGIETAKEYIKRGANVTIAARNKEKLAEAVKTLELYEFSVAKQRPKIVSTSGIINFILPLLSVPYLFLYLFRSPYIITYANTSGCDLIPRRGQQSSRGCRKSAWEKC